MNRNGMDFDVSLSAKKRLSNYNPSPGSHSRGTFPDVVKSVLEISAKQFVLDGQILIVTDKGLSHLKICC